MTTADDSRTPAPELPRAIHDLMSMPRSYRAERSKYGTWSVFWHSLELRFVEEFDGAWCFDEVVGRCWLHIEQMTDTYYWMALHPLDEQGEEIEDHARICVNIGSRSGRAAVHMTGWADD